VGLVVELARQGFRQVGEYSPCPRLLVDGCQQHSLMEAKNNTSIWVLVNASAGYHDAN
jgi:hypothetical protein